MNHYLVNIRQLEGEHAHIHHFIVRSQSEPRLETLTSIALDQFGYGSSDDEYAIDVAAWQQITITEADSLFRLGVVTFA